MGPPAARAEAPDAANEPYQWDYVFPILGRQAATRGIKFPFPFGIGLNYAVINQDIKITNLKVAVNDSDYVDLGKFVQFSRTSSSVKGLGGRFDLWVFPFLNVYGIATYALDSDTDVSLAEPIQLNAGASQGAYGGGFGVTGAFGVRGFFATLDVNFTWNKVEALDRAVGTFLLTPRVGKRLRLSRSVYWTGWVGAMRQSIQADTEGAIALDDVIGEPKDSVNAKVKDWYDSLSPAGKAVVGNLAERFQGAPAPVIHYKLDKSLADPWNMLLGMEADLNQKVQFRTEVGFIGRTQIILGINYRFGLIKN